MLTANSLSQIIARLARFQEKCGGKMENRQWLKNLRGKGERSKGRRGLEQEKRARERGISAADGRGWSWGRYRKKSSGLGLEGGYQKGRFQGGGTRHTHRHTDIYIYINTYI